MDTERREELELRYTAGWCHVMALALHHATGYRLAALWNPDDDEEEIFPGRPGGLIHYFVLEDDDTAIDVMGRRTLTEVAEAWGYTMDDMVLTEETVERVREHLPPTMDEIDQVERDLIEMLPEFMALGPIRP